MTAHQTRFRTLAFSASTASALLISLLSRDVQACSPAPTGINLSLDSLSAQGGIPANGTLILSSFCYSQCGDAETELDITATDSNGVTTTGSIVRTTIVSGSGWLAWKPAQELTPGEIYKLSVTGEFLGDGFFSQASEEQSTVDFEFFADESSDADVPEKEPELREKNAHLTFDGEQACCEDGVRDSCSELGCSLVASSVNTKVGLYFDTLLRENEMSQFVFSARVTGQEADDADIPWGPHGALNLFYDKGEEYCYEILSLHLASGKESTLVSDCIDNQGIEFPAEEGAIEEHNSHAFNLCTVPPQSGETLWCKNFSAPIAVEKCPDEGYNTEACEAALAACPAVDAADGDDNDSTDDQGDSDVAEPNQSGEQAFESNQDGGCSLARKAQSKASMPWMWLLFVSGLLSLRRWASRSGICATAFRSAVTSVEDDGERVAR